MLIKEVAFIKLGLCNAAIAIRLVHVNVYPARSYAARIHNQWSVPLLLLCMVRRSNDIFKGHVLGQNMTQSKLAGGKFGVNSL